jgi:hypothetical protein
VCNLLEIVGLEEEEQEMGLNYFMTYRVPQVKRCKQHHQIKADLCMYRVKTPPPSRPLNLLLFGHAVLLNLCHGIHKFRIQWN